MARYGDSGSPRCDVRATPFLGDTSSRSRISFEIIGSRRPKIHPVIDGQKVISHRARQRVILHGGVVPAIATGVAVTGACNDHSPLSSHHRDSLTATSKTTPSPPTRENVYGERHVRSMRRKDVVGMRARVCTCVQRIRSDQYVGLWGIFCSCFFVPGLYLPIGNR